MRLAVLKHTDGLIVLEQQDELLLITSDVRRALPGGMANVMETAESWGGGGRLSDRVTLRAQRLLCPVQFLL